MTTLIVMNSLAQQAITVPFSSSAWNTENAEFMQTTFQGKKGILLNRGVLYLEEVEFLNGVIEVDINFSDRRNFPGVRFRMEDLQNFENFYIRPHQSGNPDANQYNPVFNGTAGWQLYHGKNWSTPIAYTFGQWHHIKIVVSGYVADIYFDDMVKPLLSVDLLRDPASGSIGISTAIAPVFFANFKYTLENGEISYDKHKSNISPSTVTTWEVSQVLSDSSWLDQYTLNKNFKKSLNWQTHQSEFTGLINLARYGKRSPGRNTIIAKLEIDSRQQQLKKLDFGFSDHVRVYLNDQAIYEGEDRFRSRDYRFLGTMGFFDTLILPLNKGKNELLFVVTENFGGWAVQAKFDTMEDISLK